MPPLPKPFTGFGRFFSPFSLSLCIHYLCQQPLGMRRAVVLHLLTGGRCVKDCDKDFLPQHSAAKTWSGADERRHKREKAWSRGERKLERWIEGAFSHPFYREHTRSACRLATKTRTGEGRARGWRDRRGKEATARCAAATRTGGRAACRVWLHQDSSDATRI